MDSINVIEESAILERVRRVEAKIATDGGWIYLRFDNRSQSEVAFTSKDEFRTFLKMLMRFDERL